MKDYSIDRKYAVLMQADSSFGGQPKFKKDGYWYKYNMTGNEGLAEQLVTDVLSCSSLTDYVSYEYCKINGKLGCRSNDMLREGEALLPFSQLYTNVTGRILIEDVNSLEESERFDFIVDFIKKETGVDCSKYLFDNLTLDMLTRNPDRHFKNLALIMDINDDFRTAPIFDNGQGLMQNFTITPPDLTNEEKDDICFSCTISGSFEKQFLLAKESTGYEPFKIDYDKLSLLLNKYPDSIAKKYLEYSLDKYKNIFMQNKEIDNMDKNTTSFTIPASTKVVKNQTFSNCENLKYIKLECDLDALESIHVFAYCPDDMQIELKDGTLVTIDKFEEMLEQNNKEINKVPDAVDAFEDEEFDR